VRPGTRSAQSEQDQARSGVLIIVQNLPVPFDRRVWLECQALVNAGYRVCVICPKGPGDPRRQVIHDVHIYKYTPYPPTEQKLGFVVEYLYSFAMTVWLAARAWKQHRFQVVQACNPPDIFWPLGLVFKSLVGGYFVFDQHDLCPETYEIRFPEGARVLYAGLRLLERCTYLIADHVISTNESFRAIALGRGGRRPEDVTVVRTGPDPDRLRRGSPQPELRRGRPFLVCYLGVMGPQDGVDIVLRAADVIVHQLARHDISFTLIGKGDHFNALVALCEELQLGDFVEFTGRVPDEVLFPLLSTADLGLSPDPRNPLNDVSTMNKTMEYMAFELPVVAFDLTETRRSAGEAAVYVKPNDPELYARAIVELLDDEPRRRTMGRLARERIERELAWHHQRDAYVAVYGRLVRHAPRAAPMTAHGPTSASRV
jgi:glycosyltransferase involved in cell wall biosynthesis